MALHVRMPRKEHSPTLLAGTADLDSVDSLLRDAVDISEPSGRVLMSCGPMPGDVLSGRFVVECLTGSGGMGAIYRGKDLRTEQPVAIKVMASLGAGDANRFGQEAVVLADLSHASIVRYIAHGATPQGTPFLAMEWLEGEDLAERLARSPLTVEDSLSLVRRACEGLAVAHTRGIVHRDLKPSNLFLVDRDPASLKLIDFGIARMEARVQALTRTGVLLGTVGYMAPEQAMGASDLDARADVFALGCVLYECLTGRPAFRGQHAVAVLAKVLRDEPPRISEARPDLGVAFDALIGRLLAKDRRDRPTEASAVIRALDELGSFDAGVPASPRPGAELTDSEQRVVTVLLGQPEIPVEAGAETSAPEAAVGRLVALATRFGAQLLPLRGGAMFATLSGSGAATDHAAQAARYALALLELLPGLRIGVATGRAETTDRGPVGEAIDRAAGLVSDTANHVPGVLLDDLTASLLGPQFDTAPVGSDRALLSERGGFEAPRLLMGKPMPCIGREKELGTLQLTLDECVRDQVARAVLVTAAPGMGKSRLASEFVAGVRAGGAARVLVARADPMAARSALALVQELIRGAIGLRIDDSPAVKWERLREHLRSTLAADAIDRVAEFLGETVGISTGVTPSPVLRAARNDAAVMHEQTRRAFEAWIDAESALGPLVILLEDLHWGDAPSVAHLDEMQRRLAERPLMVLALGRPEVHERFPALWRAAALQEIRLGGLTRRAAERLALAALGHDADRAIVSRIVEQADGNAFYLEELIRRVAEGSTDLPETVLVMVQSRLERLEPDARRVLRAASTYGATCWTGGVIAMLGDAVRTGSWLEVLADREILVRSREARFPGEREYTFRHALLREGAYAMLTDNDRQSAHRSAGHWLELSGEKDPWIVADHFERGSERAKAISWMVRAALRAMERGDFAGAGALSYRGKSLGAAGQDRGALLVAQAVNQAWSGQCVAELLEEAVRLLPEGTTFWWSAVGLLIWEVARAGRPASATPYIQMALTAPLGATLSGPHGQTLTVSCFGLWVVGRADIAAALIQRFERVALADPSCDPVVLGWVRIAHSIVLPMHSARPEGILAHAEEGLGIMQDAGAVLGVLVASLRLGTILHFSFGATDDAELALKRCLGLARQAGNRIMEGTAQLVLASLDIARGRTEAALTVLRPFELSVDASVSQRARVFSAQAYARERRWDMALERALEGGHAQTPWIRQLSRVVLASIYLAQQRPAEALAALDRAAAEPPHGAQEILEPYLLVARAETLHSLGQHDAAHALVHDLRDRLLQTAATFENRALSHSFLTNIEPHARALALAAKWSHQAH
jgi:tetratricopeptide (TPR) repeat protein